MGSVAELLAGGSCVLVGCSSVLVGSLVLVGSAVLLDVGFSVGLVVEVGVDVGSSQAGKAGEEVGVSKRAISCLRRATRPGATLPPAIFHLGSSSATTVDGFSPLLRRLMRVDVRN